MKIAFFVRARVIFLMTHYRTRTWAIIRDKSIELGQ
jgi:hypothetical protein